MDDERMYLAVTVRMRDGFETEELSDSMSDKVSDKMSDKEERFYRILIERLDTEGYVTTRNMAEASGMAPSTTRRYLAELCAQGVIIQRGKNRGVKYQRA